MNYNQFAEQVKQKYPDYKSIDNKTLAQKIVKKYPQYLTQVEFGDHAPTALEKGMAGYATWMGKEGGYGSNPAGKIYSYIQKPFNKAGEYMAEQFGKRQHPIMGGALGTVTQMIPDIALSLAPGTQEKIEEPAAAVSAGRRALGFQKRFLKTPFARKTANEASRVALENKIIPRAGSADVMMERAGDLKKSAVNDMDAAFKNAYGWVEGSEPTRVEPSGIVESEVAPEGKELALNVPGLKGEANKAGDLGAKTTTFEKKARFIDPRKMIQRIEGFRPKFRGGYWDEAHNIVNKAISTIRGAGRQPLTLEDANSIKTVIQNIASYGQEGDRLIKSIAGNIREFVDTSLEEFGKKIGDPNLSSRFMRGKFNYAAASRMEEALNNKLAGDMGSMSPSLPNLVVGAGELASGNPVKAAMTVGGGELAKRRGYGVVARGISSGTKAAVRRGPGLLKSLMAKRRQDENSNP